MPPKATLRKTGGRIIARSRQIKPDFFLDEELAERKPLARLLFIGLWLLADRDGRVEDRPAKIKAQIFPYHEADIDTLLNALCPVHIVRYEVSGVRCIQVLKFSKHQHIHPDEKVSILPACPKSQTETRKSPEIPGDLKRSPEITPSSSSPSPSTSTSNSNSPCGRFIPPTLEEVRAYCIEQNNGVDPEAFLAHYTTVGWVYGKNKVPVKCWKSCVTTWKKKRKGMTMAELYE